MVQLYSKPLDRSIEVQRVIGKVKGSLPGPTIVFLGGIHGNEPAGVFALHQLMDELKSKQISVRGSIYAIAGNLGALRNGKRFEKEDLNRLWSFDQVKQFLNSNGTPLNMDREEQVDLYRCFETILESETGPYYFFDLHTTSSETLPFITVNDNLLNRKFTSQYPVPIILGIEEYLEGPILSYVNELGYVAFGFEGGQHDNKASVENHLAFSYLSLVFTQSVSREDIDYHHYLQVLAKNTPFSPSFYEIFDHFGLPRGHDFTMNPGYVNFQKIRKGQELANYQGEKVHAPQSGHIFMPLYQSQGTDGFFIIRTIPKVFLRLSAFLRKMGFDRYLTLLPGVRWKSERKDSLIVNLKLARFFTKDFFHLLGYRSKKVDRNHLIMKNREVASRRGDYENSEWYKK
ncbi:succinylglutamate desuccinylase/aspartoacylase family protein [Aureisphaera galaxeae]|uniref:succinylglutamate desuccinylase/aspartoacylase family protein n=1 Tax=Aureisphaera galaxeae TaxID=1538023 RepID=UPI0023505345|nr:succinylglutamate desuccinylase/aspartoacylase family protein [Aureisphaera galaxeae]MDC8006333.1 succinylglutamate desuccinylase/aspartoacylase family protein [Aureisphaera galaxeae]